MTGRVLAILLRVPSHSSMGPTYLRRTVAGEEDAFPIEFSLPRHSGEAQRILAVCCLKEWATSPFLCVREWLRHKPTPPGFLQPAKEVCQQSVG